MASCSRYLLFTSKWIRYYISQMPNGSALQYSLELNKSFQIIL